MPVTHVGAGHPGSTDAAAAPGVARRPCSVANCGVSTAGRTSHAEAAEAACPITARRMHLTSVSRSLSGHAPGPVGPAGKEQVAWREESMQGHSAGRTTRLAAAAPVRPWFKYCVHRHGFPAPTLLHHELQQLPSVVSKDCRDLLGNRSDSCEYETALLDLLPITAAVEATRAVMQLRAE